MTDLMDFPTRPAPEVAELAGRFAAGFTWGVATAAYTSLVTAARTVGS